MMNFLVRIGGKGTLDFSFDSHSLAAVIMGWIEDRWGFYSYLLFKAFFFCSLLSLYSCCLAGMKGGVAGIDHLIARTRTAQ